jgi:hypothetical protein
VFGRAVRTADVVLMAFVGYGALFGGLVVLLAYGRQEVVTGATLTAGGLALAGVHLWIWRRRTDRHGTAGEWDSRSKG